MKRIFILFLLLLLFKTSACAAADDFNITDDLVNSTLCKKDCTMPQINLAPIIDEFVNFADITKSEAAKIQIEDELAEQMLYVQNCSPPIVKKVIVEDGFLKFLNPAEIELPEIGLDYDYTSIKHKIIPVRIVKRITTRKLLINQKLSFQTIVPVKINNEITIPAGNEVEAKVSFIEINRMRGYPAVLIVNKFSIKDYAELKLDGQIYKRGANRSIWTTPISRILLPFWGVGYLLYPIRGGHAKIHPRQIYKLYLWEKDDLPERL